MATLSALKFNSVDGADQALGLLDSLQKQQLIQVLDAAVVTWPANNNKPKTRQLFSTAGVGAVSGAFWGILFGLLFRIPFLGMAIGAAMGALSGHFFNWFNLVSYCGCATPAGIHYLGHGRAVVVWPGSVLVVLHQFPRLGLPDQRLHPDRQSPK